MKIKMLIGNREAKDIERAVLPTIMYASEREVDYWINRTTVVTCRAIVLGWWAWGIGFMVTTTKQKEQN